MFLKDPNQCTCELFSKDEFCDVHGDYRKVAFTGGFSTRMTLESMNALYTAENSGTATDETYGYNNLQKALNKLKKLGMSNY